MEKSRMAQQVNEITVRESFSLVSEDSTVVLLDVRTPAEFQTGHLANAILIPVQELERRASELEPFKERKIIAYCRTGNRSGTAAEILTRRGYTVMNMQGGIVQWSRERLPIVYENRE